MRKFPKLVAIVLAIAIVICPAMCLSAMADSPNSYSLSYDEGVLTITVTSETGFMVSYLNVDIEGYAVDEENITVTTEEGRAFSANPIFEDGVLALLVAPTEAYDISLVTEAVVSVPLEELVEVERYYIALTKIQAADAGSAEVPESFLVFDGVDANGYVEEVIPTVDALPHECDVVEYVDNGDGTHNGVCDCEDATVLIENEDHIDEDADNVCDYCLADIDNGGSEEPEDPICEHVNITYVSHVAPIQGGANGSITYLCSDCAEEYTEEVLYDDTFKFASAVAEYKSETILKFLFSTTAANWSGVDQSKSFAILTKDNNDDEGGDAIVKVEYISDLTENGQITSNIAMVFPLAAKELNDNVARQIIVYKDGAWYSRKVGNYSFVTYAASTLAKTSVEATEKTLIMDLLNYGTIAQNRFGYNTANPANTANDTFNSYSGSTNDVTLTNNRRTDNKKDRYRFNSVAASFESRAEMNFLITNNDTNRTNIADTTSIYVIVDYIDADGAEQHMRFTGSDFRVTPSGAVYIDFSELHASQMRQEVTVTLYAADDDAVQYIVYYSLEYYAASKVGDATEGEITEALIRFGDSANAHFNK